MKAHPEAERFDMIEGDAWSAFVEDIRVNGVREAVVIHDDMILDGRNRWKAAGETGRFVPAVTYDGNDPRGFVISLNVARRHLTTKQRAAYAAELATAAHGSNQHGKKQENQKQSSTKEVPVTLQQAAEMLNVSRTSVIDAKKTMREDPVQHERDKRGEKKAKPAKAAEPAKKVAPPKTEPVASAASGSAKSFPVSYVKNKRVAGVSLYNFFISFHWTINSRDLETVIQAMPEDRREWARRRAGEFARWLTGETANASEAA